MGQCVRNIVHLDDDIVLKPSKMHHNPKLWVDVALDVLKRNPTALSVHPHFEEKEEKCGLRNDSNPPRCACANEDPSVAGFGVPSVSVPVQKAVKVSTRNGSTCGYNLAGTFKHTQHFSCQAFVVDVDRFGKLWPLAGAERHVEHVFEQAIGEQRIKPIFFSPSDIGVGKELMFIDWTG